jgi:hypothetical protein
VAKAPDVPTPHPDIQLTALPDAPEIKASPMAIPGADGKLAVVASRPQGTVSFGQVRPTITFSKPITAVSTVDVQKGLANPATITPALQGEWKWLGSASVEFVPKGLVPYSTHYTVTVPAGLVALDGTKLEQPFTFGFDMPRPEVQQVEPASGFRWIKPDQTFLVLMNQPVQDLEKSLHLTAGGKPVALKVVKETSLAEERRANEKGRHTGRMDPEDRGFQNKQTRYELKPEAALPLDANVDLVISKDLRGKEGPLTLESDYKVSFHVYGPFKLSNIKGCTGSERCSWGPAIVHTTNRVDPASVKDKVTVEPAVAIDWDRVEAGTYWDKDASHPYFSLPGHYKPGTTYKVKVAGGIVDEFKQPGNAVEGSFHTDDLEPELQTGPGLALIEGKGDGALPIQLTNLTELNTQLDVLDAASMAKLLGRPQEPTLASPSRPLAIDIKTTKNVPRWVPVKVRDAIGTSGGLFRLRFTSKDLLDYQKKQRIYPVIGQVTDLAVHAKLGARSSAVWVTRLSDGTSVADAALSLYDRDGQVKWSGKTGPDGLAAMPGMEELLPREKREEWDTEAPFALVSAQKDGDQGVTLSSWEGGLSPGAFGLSSEWATRTPRTLGTLFSERGVYRPGDEVFLKGVLRYRSLGEIKSVGANVDAAVTVRSSKGDEVFKKTVKTTRFGGFDGKFTIGSDAPLGTYEVNATVKVGNDTLTLSSSFRVEEYRAPQFKVDVTTPSPNVIAGDPLTATVVSRYLFGGAMTGVKVHWTAARSSSGFSPPGNDLFTFGANTWWWDDNQPETSSDIASGGDGEADAQGNVGVDLGKADAPGGKTYEYTIEGEATDVSRQRVANRVSVTVHPAAVYAGVRLASDGFASVGKPVKLEFVAVSPDGKRMAGNAVDVVFKRREWKSIKKKGVGGEWYTQSEPVEVQAGTCKVNSEATPVSCDFKPDAPGLYLIEAKVTDSQSRSQTTRSSFYAVGEGWVSWQRGDTDRIDLVPDKTKYDVGDTAHILIKSPYPKAEAVITVEREGVFISKKVTLAGSATSIDIPVEDSMVPNAFVGVVISRGRVPTDQGVENGADPGRPATRFGYAELKIEKKSKQLTVTVKPSATEARPRQKLQLDIQVADYKKAGQLAEVTVWAVDEGVLRLTDYKIPDLVEAIHPQRGLSVRIGEPLLHLVQRQLYGDKGLTAGGGGGDDSSGNGIRNNFKTTVLFAPTVTTDASGVAHATLELPDNLTTYRVMAVAMTEGDLVGSGQSQVVVSKKLMALPALPRLARVGDTFEAGVVVHTHGADVGQATVEATVASGGLRIDGASTKTIETADGKAREVRFKFVAEKAGQATLRFKVSGAGESDAVEQKLPVTLPISMEAVATYGDTKDTRVEGIVPPEGVRPEVGGLDLTMSSTILGGFDENMRQLVDYPYGCVEQMSSRLVPFVALREIYGKFDVKYQGPSDATKRDAKALQGSWIADWIGPNALETFKTQDPDQVVTMTVANILRQQNHDGGFRYWSALGCSSDWASSYATLALARAADVGYPVPKAALDQAKQFLSTVAGGTSASCYGHTYKVDDVTRIFALYTLARTGSPKASLYGELFARRKSLPLFAQAMLTDAMFIGGGDRAQGGVLFQELLGHAKETPKEVHFEESDPRSYADVWSSDTRTTAIVLMTLTDVAPEHPFVSKLGNYLTTIRKKDGTYSNTQEAAFSLMALAEVVRTKEKDEPNFHAKVTVGTAELAQADFKGRTMGKAAKHVDIAQVVALGSQQKMTFSKEGPGVLYYGALLRYAPVALPTTALDRGIVVQRWFEPYVGGGQSSSFYAGDLVRVRVRIATSQQRHYVAVDVPLPAGLEPVDTSLASTAQLPKSKGAESDSVGYENESGEEGGGEMGPEGEDTGAEDTRNSWAFRFWSPFNFVEQRDDRVVLFADSLPPGVHTSSFVARATTPGTFINKPAHAEEMYTPEVFGRSEGGQFTVLTTSK